MEPQRRRLCVLYWRIYCLPYQPSTLLCFALLCYPASLPIPDPGPDVALHCTALHCTVLSGRCPRRRSPRRGSSQRSSRRSVAQAFENPLSYLIGKPFEFELESGVNKVGVEIEVEIEIEVEVGLMLSTIGEHRSYMLGHWIWQRGWC